MPKVDIPATAEAKKSKRFRCKYSYLDLNGGEHLAGVDWKNRVRECFERDRGRCQVVSGSFNSDFCDRPAVHPHHKTPKGKGGDDKLSNLMSICWDHHRMVHPEKQVRLRSIPA
jgi:5-methylcytosine-specific restriction endonuclease McrA